MDRHDFCEDCSNSHACQQVYKVMGESRGPSVTVRVILAFVLPVGTFIAALAASQWVLRGVLEDKLVRTLVSFIIALVITVLVLLALRAGRRLFGYKL